jgi:hypothetical protein
MSRIITTLFLLLSISVFSTADDTSPETDQDKELTSTVNKLEEPLYTPFIERYMLDELKALRTEMFLQKNDLQKQILDREHQSVDRAVTYATNTVTYFFYLVAAASSILVIVGWTHIHSRY